MFKFKFGTVTFDVLFHLAVTGNKAPSACNHSVSAIVGIRARGARRLQPSEFGKAIIFRAKANFWGH